MTVHELTRPQLSELKQAYLCELFQNPSWSDLADAEDVPDDVIFEHYSDIDFVPDDFSPYDL